MNDRTRKLGGTVLIALAAILFVVSAPCLLGGVLGLAGVLADVSYPENYQMGRQALGIAAYPLGGGLLALLAGILVRRSRPK